jgi:exopolysaccharide biosynthesis predicted pyruvyltransferase EpsI
MIAGVADTHTAPVIAGLSQFPRIEDIDAKTGEVLYVARDEREAMFNRGRSNHAVRRIEGRSS